MAKMMNEDETTPKQSFETIKDGRKHKNLKHHKNLTQIPQLVWSFSILVSIGSSLSRWWIYECLGKVIRGDTECLGVPCVVMWIRRGSFTASSNPHQSTPIHTCTQSAPIHTNPHQILFFLPFTPLISITLSHPFRPTLLWRESAVLARRPPVGRPALTSTT